MSGMNCIVWVVHLSFPWSLGLERRRRFMENLTVVVLQVYL